MSYVKTTWSNGDTITADKLNHMETGIYDASQGGGGGGSGVFVAHFEVTWVDEHTKAITCDKTVDEIVDAYVSNEFVCAKILFYETTPELTAFDIYASDDQQYGKTVDIYLHHVWVEDYAQASAGDALVCEKIYYDNVREQWSLQEVVYALTPFVS